MKRDIHTEITNFVLDNIDGDVLPWRRKWHTSGPTIALPRRNTGEPYRGTNHLLLNITSLKSGFSSPYWMTYNQAKSVGANVLKGQKGSRIVKFKPLTIESPEANGQERVIPMIRNYTVFNLEQIENLPDDYQSRQHVQTIPVSEVYDYLKAVGAEIIHGDSKAGFYPVLDVIRMPNIEDFTDQYAYESVLAHELVHWTGHGSRLNRLVSTEEDTAEYAFEELVAEIGSMILCAHLGIESVMPENHLSYVKHYVTIMQADKKAIVRASSEAQKAVDFILEAANTHYLAGE